MKGFCVDVREQHTKKHKLPGRTDIHGMQTDPPADSIARVFRTLLPGRLCPLNGRLFLYNWVIASDLHLAKTGDDVRFYACALISYRAKRK